MKKPASSQRDRIALTPAAMLANYRFEHRTCGMQRDFVAHLRSCEDYDSLASELLTPLALASGVATVAVIISLSPIGPPKSAKQSSDASGPEAVVWLLLDPLDIDSKQTTFVAHDSFADSPSTMEALFGRLYKWRRPEL